MTIDPHGPQQRLAGSFGTDTEAGSLLGTPAYMPPEQANGDIANLDRRADVFGLGAILCEILTGKPPYRGPLRRGSAPQGGQRRPGRRDGAAGRLRGGRGTDRLDEERACRPRRSTGRRTRRRWPTRLTAYLDGVQERLQAAERERAVAEAHGRRGAASGDGAAGAGGDGCWRCDAGRAEHDLLPPAAGQRRLMASRLRPWTGRGPGGNAARPGQGAPRGNRPLAGRPGRGRAGRGRAMSRGTALLALRKEIQAGLEPAQRDEDCSIAWSTSARPRPTIGTARSPTMTMPRLPHRRDRSGRTDAG